MFVIKVKLKKGRVGEQVDNSNTHHRSVSLMFVIKVKLRKGLRKHTHNNVYIVRTIV